VWQELADTGRLLSGQPFEHVLEIAIRIVAVEFGGLDQLMMTAARRPARREPANNQLDRPKVTGRIRFLDLTRFRGHLKVSFGGVHDGEQIGSICPGDLLALEC